MEFARFRVLGFRGLGSRGVVGFRDLGLGVLGLRDLGFGF